MSNPYLPFRATIIEVRRETAVDFTYRLEADMQVAGGQFVEVSIPGVGEAPISVSDFGDGWIEMTIRNVGRLTNVIHHLRPGNSLFIRGPYGRGFPLERYAGKDLIIAAGGTGLAPVKSLLNRYGGNPGEVKSLTLLAGFKTPADILFRDEIERWRRQHRVEITVDRDDAGGWPGRVGLITGLIARETISQPENTVVIVVGPPAMMKFSTLEFIKRGIKQENIWVSFERKMCCGIGKCGHCKIDGAYVCLEGPVFNYTTAGRLID